MSQRTYVYDNAGRQVGYVTDSGEVWREVNTLSEFIWKCIGIVKSDGRVYTCKTDAYNQNFADAQIGRVDFNGKIFSLSNSCIGRVDIQGNIHNHEFHNSAIGRADRTDILFQCGAALLLLIDPPTPKIESPTTPQPSPSRSYSGSGGDAKIPGFVMVLAVPLFIAFLVLVFKYPIYCFLALSIIFFLVCLIIGIREKIKGTESGPKRQPKNAFLASLYKRFKPILFVVACIVVFLLIYFVEGFIAIVVLGSEENMICLLIGSLLLTVSILYPCFFG